MAGDCMKFIRSEVGIRDHPSPTIVRMFLWRMCMFDDTSVRHVQTYGMVLDMVGVCNVPQYISLGFQSSRFSCIEKNV